LVNLSDLANWAQVLSVVPLVGTPILLARKYNCHVKGCWRVGRHSIADTIYVVCRRHHPDPKPTVEEVASGR
jgi:hypothetical protein